MHTLQERAGQAYRYLRYLVRAGALAFPKNVHCNLCGWQGRHFLSDGWHDHSKCPKCQSHIRHRLLAAALAHIEAVSCARIMRGKHVLHFAPERPLQGLLRNVAEKYVTADRNNRRRDLQTDIADMKSIAAASFDVVIACDVLEHVPDDRRALREIARVLRPAGFAVLTVPQKDDLATTLEDPAVCIPTERERVFGQADHVRIYGEDFVERVAAAGFEVRTIDHKSFAPQMVQRHVLFPPLLSKHPLATNYRKVFFAEKCPCCPKP